MAHSIPTIQLTPIEETFRLLLLDVVEFIRKKQPEQKNGEENTASRPELELRFTGGWVRDKVLGVESHDIDVGISTMTGYQFGLALKEYLDIPENLRKYKEQTPDGELKEDIVSLHKIDANPEKSKHLETVTTKIFGLDIDLVNLRKETYSEDSRNPQMGFGTPIEDALRRDANVNAMFYNIHTSSLEDFTGRGLEDIRQRLLRTPLPPYQTFKDDPLRVLRLIRFASRLGYSIDEETEIAMRNEDIKLALRAKISPERVGTEIEKTLKGPDPRGALRIIDRLGLHSTIFANHRDEETADTSKWERAYNTVPLFLENSSPTTDQESPPYERARETLIRDNNIDPYYCWVLAALSPWATVPAPKPKKEGGAPSPPRASTVARDSLRLENKTLNILSDAVNHYKEISTLKTSIVDGTLVGDEAQIRQNIGEALRRWGNEWRLCVVLAILLDIMRTNDSVKGTNPTQPDRFVNLANPIYAPKVFTDYDKLLSYIRDKNLLDVVFLKPLINGRDLTNALDVKQGPWVTQALEMVIGWQLRNPNRTDTEGPTEEVLSRKEELKFNVVNSKRRC